MDGVGSAYPAASTAQEVGQVVDGTYLPTPNEQSVFTNLFRMADVKGQGSIGGADAVNFLKRSGLDNLILREIWNIAVVDSPVIQFKEFFTIMRLISIAQTGAKVGTWSLTEFATVPLALPKFEGVELPQPQVTQLQRQSSSSASYASTQSPLQQANSMYSSGNDLMGGMQAQPQMGQPMAQMGQPMAQMGQPMAQMGQPQQQPMGQPQQQPMGQPQQQPMGQPQQQPMPQQPMPQQPMPQQPMPQQPMPQQPMPQQPQPTPQQQLPSMPQSQQANDDVNSISASAISTPTPNVSAGPAPSGQENLQMSMTSLHSALTESTRRVKAEIENAKREITSMASAKNALVTDLTETDRSLKTSMDELAQLDGELNSMRAEVAKLRQQVVEKGNELLETKEKMIAKQTEAQSLQKEIGNLKNNAPAAPVPTSTPGFSDPFGSVGSAPAPAPAVVEPPKRAPPAAAPPPVPTKAASPSNGFEPAPAAANPPPQAAAAASPWADFDADPAAANSANVAGWDAFEPSAAFPDADEAFGNAFGDADASAAFDSGFDSGFGFETAPPTQ